MDNSTILVILTAVLLGVFILCVCLRKHALKSREPYQDLFYAKDYAQGNWVSRPNFRADLDPRFDATRVGGGNIVGSFPGMSVQASPVTPVESLVPANAAPSFAVMGGMNGAYADPRLPSGGLTTGQVNNILMEKFGRGAGGTYTEPKELLPTPDMKKALARDPSQPSTFMYDRYLFSNLKRRYPQTAVDFVRGDLNIPQIKTGWFDSRNVSNYDLQQGYFADYLDIQQSTSLRDSLFERTPSPAVTENPWGDISSKTMYSLV